jgi:hypothetical protein
MKSILLAFATSIFLLNANSQVIADAGPDRKGCVNDTFKAVGKGLNPGDTGSYLWTDLNAGVLSNQQMLIKLFPPHQYHIELKVTRLHNGITYIDRDSFYLTVNGLPQIKLFTPDTICSSAPAVTMQSNYAQNDPNGKWIGKYITGSSFDPSLSPKTQAFEVVKIVYKYTNPLTLCTDSAITKKTLQSQPSIAILNNNPYQLCEDQIFHLNANVSNALNVVWTTSGDGIFGNATKATTTYVCGNQDTANGNCTVTVKTNQFGQCPSSNSTITLVFEAYPLFSMPIHYVSCEPAVINFDTYVFKPSGASNLRYSWYFGNGDSLIHSTNGSPQSIQYPIAKQGWYDVKIKVHNQWGTGAGEECTITKDSLDYVRVLPQPAAAFTSDPAYSATADAPTFNFTNQSSIRWGKIYNFYNFDALNNSDDTSSLDNPSHTYSSDTANYQVSLISYFKYPKNADLILTEDFLCWDTISATRKIVAAEEELKIFTIDKNKRINISIPFNGDLAIMDANGDAIELRKTKAGKREQLDIEDWNAGCYIIVLDNGSKRKYAKFMKY